MAYCPCCRNETEMFCQDCEVPSLPEVRHSHRPICDCMEKPLGQYLVDQLKAVIEAGCSEKAVKGEFDDLKQKVRELTGLEKDSDVESYMRELLGFHLSDEAFSRLSISVA